MAVYITWFFNHGQSSLLLPVAFHIGFNLVNVVWLPVTTNINALVILIVLEWVLALCLVPFLETKQMKIMRTVTV